MTATLIQFPASRVDRVEILRGTDKEYPGHWVYFLEMVERDGGRSVVFKAPDYRAVILASRKYQRDGIRVVDWIGGAA